MSIVYTADVFCDGDDCCMWTHGKTEDKPPAKWEARHTARRAGWTRSAHKDYCPSCSQKQKQHEAPL